MKLSANAPSFKPTTAAQPKAYPAGVTYNGTDEGAMIQDYFFLETPAQKFRTTLPHAHVTIGHDGGINVSYSSRSNTKIGSVNSETDWNAIKADSAPIHAGLFAFFGWS